MNIQIRRAEPGDYKAVQQVHAQPNALRGTLQLPFPSEESWKERLAKFGANDYALVACIEGEIVGMLSLMATTPSPRRSNSRSGPSARTARQVTTRSHLHQSAAIPGAPRGHRP